MTDTPKCPHCDVEGVYLGQQRSRDSRNGRPYTFWMGLCPECLSSYGGPHVYDDTGKPVPEREHEARHDND